MSQRSEARSPSNYTVGIICAMSFEMSAIRYMLDNEHEMRPIEDVDSTIYTLGDVHGLNIVLGCLSGQQGKGAAAVVAANMSRTFPHIKWRLLVGIGGGVPSDKHDIRLGDVVVSMPEGQHGGVVQYDLGKSSGAGFQLKGFLQLPPALLRSAVERMESDHLVRDSRILEFIDTMEPRDVVDTLFQDDFSHGDAVSSSAAHDPPQIVTRSPREFEGPYIHYGLIASGDSVLKSASKRKELVGALGDVLCFEMEAAGLMSEYPCLVIRGVSDYADSHKNDAWHKYAAATAAACTKEVLSYLRVKDVAAMLEMPDADAATMEWHHQQQPHANVFHGKGFQHTGTGNFSIGGDSNIL
ncbi:nucleoside phosphorylase domain-containing protein [Emericellopsis atlantica]|uniref:Nucleoside phosphorylase domain-containing protein n=1 Tax=Emericellopsis atlantica TaxID=2614577 RepID=A0A9P7ZI30_9HYPO|nr:nucleoside phosphorylase domain-containing protein [Emericellopsis atlantica]KAG9251960.1 nucleoside phosphorylase domain-containing protein [Emericellopsis atlantica]